MNIVCVPARIDESIIIGLKTKSAPPINAIFSSKNFLQNRYTGMIVITEIIIDNILCKLTYSRKVSSGINEKKVAKNNDQPLFDKNQSSGIIPKLFVLTAYSKKSKPSCSNGIPNGK